MTNEQLDDSDIYRRESGRVTSVRCWCCEDWCSPECVDDERLCIDCQPCPSCGGVTIIERCGWRCIDCGLDLR